MQVFKLIADRLVIDVFRMSPSSHWGGSLHFFIEDTLKIFVMVVFMIYAVGVLRAGMNLTNIRQRIEKMPKVLAYPLSAIFGAITPFCSCSSIPFFLGFTQAGIPAGITFSFLITSPLINEVALILLSGILGIKFTLIYVSMGLLTGIIGGFLFDLLKADHHLQELTLKVKKQKESSAPSTPSISPSLSLKERHLFALNEVRDILKRISKWILIGVALGALLHGLVPQEWIAQNLGNKSGWSVPGAVLLGIPLYSNASGMVPIVETLMAKGLPVGTAMALMMSTVGASFPEFLMLKQVVKPRILVYLFVYFLISFTLLGWLLNLVF